MRRRDFLLGTVTALAALGLPRIAAAEIPRKIVLLQPLDPAPGAEWTAFTKKAIETYYAFDVQVLAPVPMPKTAWYAPRERWRAEKLIAHLSKSKPDSAHRILGVTSADISTTKGPHADWGVLGLGDIDGAGAVLSTFRTRRNVPKKTSIVRFAKVAVHELGHTLGLEHCPFVGCLMEDANAQVATCDRENRLCERCRGLLARAGYVLPAEPGEAFWVA